MNYNNNAYFSIVLPAYNEAENLPNLLRGIKKVLDGDSVQSEIIVVNNGSSDNTAEVLDSLKKEIAELRTLRIEKNIGFGNGIIKGLESARGSILGFMVSDGQITPEGLISVYRELKKNNLDLCKGLRMNRQDGFVRLAISKVYNILLGVMFDCPVKDINGMPKIFTRRFYELAKPVSKDFFIDAEILIKARENNFSFKEVPVISPARERGSSTVSILTPLGFLRSMFYRFLLGKYR